VFASLQKRVGNIALLHLEGATLKPTCRSGAVEKGRRML